MSDYTVVMSKKKLYKFKPEEQKNKLRAKLEKITAFWKRVNPQTSPKIHIKPLKKNQKIPLDLIELMLNFSEYVCLFDIFTSQYTTKTSYPSHDLFTIDKLTASLNTCLACSKTIQITNSFTIKLIRQPDTMAFNIYIGIQNLIPNSRKYGNYLAVRAGHAYGALETRFYGKKYNQHGTAFDGFKPEDIMQIKRTKDGVEWLKNNKLVVRRHIHPINTYFFWVSVAMGWRQRFEPRQNKTKLANESIKLAIY